MTESVFAKFQQKSYPYRFHGSLVLDTIAGGVPSDPKVAEGWLKTKLAPNDDLLRQMVAEVMAERGVTAEEAAGVVDELKHLVGFRRDEQGLYIPGFYLMAGLKEWGNICTSSGKLPLKWGKSGKYWSNWSPEHVCVVDERLHLGVTHPTGIAQSFPKSRFGSSIQYTEYVEDAKIDFTVETDHDFTAEQWAMIWTTGERNGLGSSRSQGYGKFTVTRWEQAR